MNSNFENNNKKSIIQNKKFQLGVLFAVCVIFIGVLMFLAKSNSGKKTDDALEALENSTTREHQTVAGGSKDELESEANNVMAGDDVKNFLLVGQDRREGEGRQRSDSMIIASVNRKTKEITMVSLMRDMYLEIPGYDKNRINASYQFGGMELLDQTIKNNFGVKISGNIEVDFDTFTEIVDMMGGVNMELYDAEVTYLNNQNSSWTLSTGTNHLTGEQTLAYARCRHVGNNDFERTDRQRRIMAKLFEKAKEQDVEDMVAIANKMFSSITTDMSVADIAGYAYLVLNGEYTMADSYRIPAEGAYTEQILSNGMDVLIPDVAKNKELIKKYLYSSTDGEE